LQTGVKNIDNDPTPTLEAAVTSAERDLLVVQKADKSDWPTVPRPDDVERAKSLRILGDRTVEGRTASIFGPLPLISLLG
jgi:hypothetical protein